LPFETVNPRPREFPGRRARRSVEIAREMGADDRSTEPINTPGVSIETKSVPQQGVERGVQGLTS